MQAKFAPTWITGLLVARRYLSEEYRTIYICWWPPISHLSCVKLFCSCLRAPFHIFTSASTSLIFIIPSYHLQSFHNRIFNCAASRRYPRAQEYQSPTPVISTVLQTICGCLNLKFEKLKTWNKGSLKQSCSVFLPRMSIEMFLSYFFKNVQFAWQTLTGASRCISPSMT